MDTVKFSVFLPNFTRHQRSLKMKYRCYNNRIRDFSTCHYLVYLFLFNFYVYGMSVYHVHAVPMVAKREHQFPQN